MTGSEVGRAPVWDDLSLRLRPPGWRTLLHWRARRELKAARRAADERLMNSATAPLDVKWRVDEITSAESRLEVATALRRTVQRADPRLLPGASPLNRPAVRVQADHLNAIADLLSDTERPIEYQGILLIAHLLADDQGPLYVTYRARELESALEQIERALKQP